MEISLFPIAQDLTRNMLLVSTDLQVTAEDLADLGFATLDTRDGDDRVNGSTSLGNNQFRLKVLPERWYEEGATVQRVLSIVFIKVVYLEFVAYGYGPELSVRGTLIDQYDHVFEGHAPSTENYRIVLDRQGSQRQPWHGLWEFADSPLVGDLKATRFDPEVIVAEGLRHFRATFDEAAWYDLVAHECKLFEEEVELSI